MPGEPYFSWSKKYLQDFLGSNKADLIFIPFAGVTISYNEYFNSVSKTFHELGCSIKSIHEFDNKKSAIKNSSGIVVGGGNTFQLLSKLYEYDLLTIIREKINAGSPYIGWSAGSNVTCPTIKTTNDMPVVQPPSFKALDLVPFQINPHYTEATIPNHGGESRDVRLKEFIEVNQNVAVIGLPEGNLLEVQGKKISLKGTKPAKIFKYGKEPVDVSPGDDINRLLTL